MGKSSTIWRLVKSFDGRRSSRSSRVDVEECRCVLLEETIRPEERKLVRSSSSSTNTPPKGYVAVYVGEEESVPKRYVIPAVYLSMPAFGPVMEMARKEFGFKQSGGLRLPCCEFEFEEVLRVMETEKSGGKRKSFKEMEKMRFGLGNHLVYQSQW